MKISIYNKSMPNPAGAGSYYATAFSLSKNKLMPLAGPFKSAVKASKAADAIKPLAGDGYTAFGTAYLNSDEPGILNAKIAA